MIYLDHAATTPVNEQVIDIMYKLTKEIYGNPSSIHSSGRQSKKYLNEARRFLASSINAKESEIYFTSGGTEANNLAVIGTAIENEYDGNHIITSAQEHHAIIHIMQYLQRKGFHVTYLPIDKNGQIDINDLERSLTDQTILVSIMTANNETGVLQPIKEIGELLKNHQAYFHTDAVQAYGLIDIDVADLGIDLLSTSAHKLNGPKGTGFLYVNEKTAITQIQYGGLQEKMKRPGTENLIGAYGFFKAAENYMNHMEEYYERFHSYKMLFIETLNQSGIAFSINGDINHSLPTILNLSFPGTTADVLLTNFDLAGINASSGSACTAGALEPSHVLKAMYNSRDERINNSVRFSFGTANTKENIIEAAKRISEVVKRLTS